MATKNVTFIYLNQILADIEEKNALLFIDKIYNVKVSLTFRTWIDNRRFVKVGNQKESDGLWIGISLRIL